MFIFFFFSFACLFLSYNGSFDSDIRILCCVDREIILMRWINTLTDACIALFAVMNCKLFESSPVIFCRLEFTIEAMNRIGFGLFRFTHCFFGEPSVLSHVVLFDNLLCVFLAYFWLQLVCGFRLNCQFFFELVWQSMALLV